MLAGRHGAECALRRLPQPGHDDVHEVLESRGPAVLWRRLQHEAFPERQQQSTRADELAPIENAEGPVHRNSSHIAQTRALPRWKTRELIGEYGLTLFTARLEVAADVSEEPPRALPSYISDSAVKPCDSKKPARQIVAP